MTAGTGPSPAAHPGTPAAASAAAHNPYVAAA